MRVIVFDPGAWRYGLLENTFVASRANRNGADERTSTATNQTRAGRSTALRELVENIIGRSWF